MDGSQGANKVLQSDANGNASWATNVAMQVGKKAGLNPRAAAEILQPFMEALAGVEAVEIA
ncbi:MAG: arginine--tRNA ligase, partial [Cyclobacteriaceae bacterium]|nr:arginine--tRNA ligase [Cyclobacteriaceae bacterium]